LAPSIQGKLQRYQSHHDGCVDNGGRPAKRCRAPGRALAAHERANGPNHLWTKDSAGVTAAALAALGRAEEAQALRKKYSLEDRAV
jgi:hypothetical protein